MYTNNVERWIYGTHWQVERASENETKRERRKYSGDSTYSIHYIIIYCKRTGIHPIRHTHACAFGLCFVNKRLYVVSFVVLINMFYCVKRNGTRDRHFLNCVCVLNEFEIHSVRLFFFSNRTSFV